MKKLIVSLGAVALAFGLTACGGGTKTASDAPAKDTAAASQAPQASENPAVQKFGWYEVEVPKPFEADKFGEEFKDPADRLGTKKIKIYATSNVTGNAAEETKQILEGGRNNNETAGEDLQAGGRTWKVVNFTWDNDTPSAHYLTDVGDSYVEVAMFCLTYDSPEGKQFLDTIKFTPEDKVQDAYNAWMKKME